MFRLSAVNAIIGCTTVSSALALYGDKNVRAFVEKHTVLRPRAVAERPWLLLTYTLVHGSELHFLFNMYALKSFGDVALHFLSTPRFVGLYVAAGLVGGGTQLLYQRNLRRTRWPARYRVDRDAAAVGASGAVLGVSTYIMCLTPSSSILLFGIVPVKTYMFLPAFLAYTAWGCYTGGSALASSEAHAAHLGGVVTGAAFFAFRAALIARRGAR